MEVTAFGKQRFLLRGWSSELGGMGFNAARLTEIKDARLRTFSARNNSVWAAVRRGCHSSSSTTFLQFIY